MGSHFPLSHALMNWLHMQEHERRRNRKRQLDEDLRLNDEERTHVEEVLRKLEAHSGTVLLEREQYKELLERKRRLEQAAGKIRKEIDRLDPLYLPKLTWKALKKFFGHSPQEPVKRVPASLHLERFGTGKNQK